MVIQNYVPAHRGIAGNEQADRLAKAGAGIELVNRVQKIGASIKQANQLAKPDHQLALKKTCNHQHLTRFGMSNRINRYHPYASNHA